MPRPVILILVAAAVSLLGPVGGGAAASGAVVTAAAGGSAGSEGPQPLSLASGDSATLETASGPAESLTGSATDRPDRRPVKRLLGIRARLRARVVRCGDEPRVGEGAIGADRRPRDVEDWRGDSHPRHRWHRGGRGPVHQRRRARRIPWPVRDRRSPGRWHRRGCPARHGPPVFAFLATQGNGTPVDRRRRAFAGASVLTLTAALAQTGLVVLMLLAGSVASTGQARACICAAGLVVAALVVSTPITALKQIGGARESASI